MLQAIEWAMDVFGGRTSGRVEDDHGLMASLLEADPSQERTWFKVNGEGLHLLHEDSDRHSDCPIVGRRVTKNEVHLGSACRCVESSLDRSPRMLVASYRSFSWCTGNPRERGYVYRSYIVGHERRRPPRRLSSRRTKVAASSQTLQMRRRCRVTTLQ